MHTTTTHDTVPNGIQSFAISRSTKKRSFQTIYVVDYGNSYMIPDR